MTRLMCFLRGGHRWLRYSSFGDEGDKAFVEWDNGARIEVCNRCGFIKPKGRAPVQRAAG